MEEQISYAICEAFFLENEANLAKIAAEQGKIAAARAAAKRAGLTCDVGDNCINGDISPDDGGGCIEDPANAGQYYCPLKEGKNPEGVDTTDGSQTACTSVVDVDGVTYSASPCSLFGG